jgi:hypothetical protein
MPTPAQLTVATLRDQIKREGRISGSDNLDGFILDLINELLLEYTEKNRYFELLTTNYTVPTVAAQTGYTLPTDFFAERLVRYQSANGSPFTLRKRTEWIENPRGTMPRWYEIVGTVLNIFPYTDVPDADTIYLDYYKYPQTLATGDVFPIPRLLPTLKIRAVHRVLIYNNNLQQSAALKGESLEMDFKVRPNNN